MNRFHFQILDKTGGVTTEHSNSADQMINSGFGEMDDFEGWIDEETARYWGRDRMKLYSITNNPNFELKIYQVNIKIKPPTFVPREKQPYVKKKEIAPSDNDGYFH